MDPNNSKDTAKPNGSDRDPKEERTAGACGGEDSIPNSPRDIKKPKTETPTNSPRRGERAPSPNLMVAASPPKYVSFEEIMQAANGVSNMTLAHEIAVDSDFRFEKSEVPANSLEQQVKSVMERAFWDSLQEKLNEDPPEYGQALVLLQEVKETLLDLLLPQHMRIRARVEEVLDLELIEQKAEHEALDFQYYADFVISIMARLCSPARDENIAKLQQITDVVPLYKELFATLDLMKMDMANFTIQQIRPYLQQQSVDYERKKFQDFLAKQKENGIDGLKFTKAWLQRSADELQSLQSPEGASETVPSTPSVILNNAYLQLLQWQDNLGYPETILMDEGRFQELQAMTQWLSLVSAILLVTYNTVGAPISGIRGLKEKLKDDIGSILAGVPYSRICDLMPSVSEHVVKEVQEVLTKHGFSEMDSSKQSLLKGQIEAVVSEDHPVHKIMRKRILDFVLGLISTPRGREVKIPVGFSSIHEEISHMCGKFLRLVSHNRSVFGLYYADIIAAHLKASTGDISPGPSPR